MTIEAETLVQLTEALKKRGMNRIADINFIRAPYRHDHKWTCSFSRAAAAGKNRKVRN